MVPVLLISDGETDLPGRTDRTETESEADLARCGEICAEEKIDLFIDDSVENLQMVKGAVKKVLLFNSKANKKTRMRLYESKFLERNLRFHKLRKNLKSFQKFR